MSGEARGRMAVDALAVAVATAAAFIFRAAVREFDSLAPGHLASLIFPALLLVIPVSLIALWAGGAYGRAQFRAWERSFTIASALAWAAAPLAFVAVHWGKGPEAPMIVMAVGYLAAVACVLAGRHLLDARAVAAAPR